MKASLELEKRWRATKTLLQRAHQALPASNKFERAAKEKEFEEFVAQNELGLALDVLEEIGSSVACRGGFWRDLERAAQWMELSERAKGFRARFLAAKPISGRDAAGDA